MILAMAAYLSFFYFTTLATAPPSFCASEAKPEITRRYPVSGEINYFIRAAPRTRQVSFATSEANKILDIETGKTETVPGFIDPVMTPDGELLSIPSTKFFDPTTKRARHPEGRAELMNLSSMKYLVSGSSVYEFVVRGETQSTPSTITFRQSQRTRDQIFSMNEPFAINEMDFQRRSASGKFESIGGDPEISENYQSLGQLRATNSSAQYRMLFAGANGLSYRDYSLNKTTNKIEPAGPITPACGTKTLDVSLPMINKDGTEFSVYDYGKDKTLVYAIDSGKKTCTVVEELPFLAGKIDFSEDGKKLAFHVDSAEHASGSFETPDEASRLGVFVYDRASKTTLPVAAPEGEDAYYPVFLDNDTIAFASASKGNSRKFHINVAKINAPPVVDCADCTANRRNGQLAALIGLLHSRKCGLNVSFFTTSLANFMRLTPGQCMALVKGLQEDEVKKLIDSFSSRRTWNTKLMAELKLTELSALCQGKSPINESSGSGDTVR